MIKFTLFFLSLSFLIILHEFGHYITARWFKTKVDKFYLFFDFLFPFNGILKFSLFKKKIGDTEYGLGWFPFGGYVDIAGMASDPDDPTKAPEPHEFRAKKPWQRLIILAGGVTVNALLAIIIYIGIMWAWGEDYLPTKNVKYGVYCDSLAIKAGFQHGDKILSLDGVPEESFGKISTKIILDRPKTVQVERNGAIVNIPIAAGLDTKVVEKEAASLFEPQLLFIADSVLVGKAAAKAGLKKGDQLVKLGSDSIVYFQQFAMGLQRYKAIPTTITVIRDNQLVVLSVTPDADGKIGVQPQGPDKQLGYKHTDYGFGGACVRGVQLTGEKLVSYVKQLRLVFTKEGASKIGGFASIGSIFPSSWDWQAFWSITAFLSIILAFMNLLPIPVLDGGYILFVLWEMITGRKVSDKVMSVAMSIGMFLVLALLLLANGNDIYRFLIK